MITLKPPKRKLDLQEIGQMVPYKFAFITKDNRLCHTPVMCRDFLQDALRNLFQDAKSNIYGFEYDKKQDAVIETDEIRIAVYNINHKQMKIALQILNVFETDAKFGLTYAEGTTTDKVFVFIGSKEWLSSPFGISLYTFLIRLAHREPYFNTKEQLIHWLHSKEAQTPRKTNDNDAEYLRATNDILWKIAPNLKCISWKEVDYRQHNIHHFHNCSGVVSLAKLRLENKKWTTAVKQHIL